MPKAAAPKRTRAHPEKKKKDPNAPKRGLSAYMFFANDQRESVRNDFPGIAFGAVGKELGFRWKKLDDAQKAPYEEKAAKDKKRYEEQKANYNAEAEAEAEADVEDEESS